MASEVESAGRRAEEMDELEELSSVERIHALLVRELGEELADAFAQSRALQERLERRRHPEEGLRERKKRQTRQQISDVATALFVVRGFDRVTVAEIARIVGVSEKTVFNYFPTKESLVFDRADEGVEQLVAALSEREPGESPTKAMLRALDSEPEELAELPDAIQMFTPLFSEMVASTPALRAAWLELHDRLVEAATRELAARAGVDPGDPEPMVAARAIVGLLEVNYASRIRHIEAGLRGPELHEAVRADVERGARLLDTGLWSFGLLTQGARTRAQVQEAAQAAEAARGQVMDALKQAREAWRELRRREQEERGKERRERGREQAKRKQAQAKAKRAAAGARRRAQDEMKQALKQAAKDAAYEAFRQALGERHEAIRKRHESFVHERERD
ncbi:MAG TPA: TetR family transcriptional regulator [Solirubrobacteraceae bacterium]|nr:TetR family transcriptional regulator [Solirubrobacteraceae bacterium]